MDKDFEKKVKQKRIRAIVVTLVVLAALGYLITGTKVEKADYTNSLRSEIESAQALYDENENNTGNKKGQYTKAVMAQFAADIKAAQTVLDDKASEYNDIKTAYETLKAKIDAFKKAANERNLKPDSKETEKKAVDDDDESEVDSEENSEVNAEEEAVDTHDSKEASAAEKESEKEPTKKPAESQPTKPEEEQQIKPTEDIIKVSLTIRCDVLATDLSKLRDPALASYVPSDGVILSLDKVKVTKGESVYDVLDRVCRDKGIHMEAVYTPNYGADYIEGINYLYEFDAGEQSGWMYKVNGAFPSYGCSDYILEDGDKVVWAYTCDMGKDLGK